MVLNPVHHLNLVEFLLVIVLVNAYPIDVGERATQVEVMADRLD
jgi:hypothetical protein